MSLWSWLRNHKQINDLERKVQSRGEALKTAHFEVDSLTKTLNQQTEDMKILQQKLDSKTAEKIEVTREINENIAGATISRGPVDDKQVSMKELAEGISHVVN